ncbi:MAG: hypothetical protein ACFFDL_14110 [Promethearchaeota archaeon]
MPIKIKTPEIVKINGHSLNTINFTRVPVNKERIAKQKSIIELIKLTYAKA